MTLIIAICVSIRCRPLLFVEGGIIFCQNRKISNDGYGKKLSLDRLSEIMLELQDKGAHNINLVTPTHFVPALAKVLREYKSPVPVVYNSSGYEKAETLKMLEGLVDIYLPDIKYFDSAPALKYSGAEDYFEYASSAVLEMYRQVGNLKIDENGILYVKGETVCARRITGGEEIVTDGWFKTGDLGIVDRNNCYKITGRCKNVIVTKNGKNIFPEEVEIRDKSVLSFTPALCASMQTALCVKLLTGRAVETGRIFYFDLLNQEFETIPMV